MSKYPIKKGVPIPPTNPKRPLVDKFGLNELEIGDCMEIPHSEFKEMRDLINITAYMKRRTKKQFAIRKR